MDSAALGPASAARARRPEHLAGNPRFSHFALAVSVSTPLTLFLTQLLGEPPAPVQAWWASAQRVQLQRGQPLLQAGDRWQHLWWVERGALRLYYLDCEGGESNKNFFLEGSMLWPITPRLRDTPAMFHVEPTEDATVVWALPVLKHAEAAAQGWPAWAQLEHRTLCALLDGKMQREQDFLQLSARQRYEQLVQQRPAWAARIPLRHLASFLGMTDVTLSRVRSEMGLIKS